ncbi:6-hydroxy-D-nicotine oxidase [Colletotrichum orbiculare MAFF 240422]|uniref:6-hydroxy-D-nicotine oxidase n=1 Tax=Colletotrichum orbiculare (strain 104-T / ATCC 96160 / CBS 514.97 / LARS 414 / MAFF 240422) TaxID=1213857 RepID=A0A484FG92_COLOR|nr:6-hydroxy-D-nicotine oxidase [Colletotrichum orbiculare MAFF 240422]
MCSDSQSKTRATLEPLIRSLKSGSVLTPVDSAFALHSEPFAVQKQLHPPVVLVPSSVEEVSLIIRFLYKSDLDFAIRGHGFKSPSAKDVVVSMLSFKDIEYDHVKKIANVGASATWSEVVTYMEKADPEYSIAAARTPSIGVAGTVLNGGLSWMSTEYGCISDPVNFLDAEVVKYDGSVVMASQEPDLLWSLRGSGGGFGIITKILLRAHYYPTNIWSGMVLVPRKWLPQLVDEIVEFNNSVPHPKVTYFVYFLPERLLPTILEQEEPEAGDAIIFHVYDALGEEHGRKAFGWVLDKPGAIDRTRVTNMKGVVDMQRNAALLRGTTKTMYAPMALPDLDQATIHRAVQFYDKLGSLDKSIQEISSVIFECLLVRPPIGGTAEIAWPRSPGLNHLLLLIASCPADGPKEQEDLLRQISVDAPKEVLGDKLSQVEVNPAGLEPSYHNVRDVYREHYDKLVALRRVYDPSSRFKSFFG